MTDLTDFQRRVHEPLATTVAQLAETRVQLARARNERDEWSRQCSEWKRHATRLESESFQSEEYRAFVRLLLAEAIEGLEDGTPEGMKDSLLAIRDLILPPEERREARARDVLLPEQRMLVEGTDTEK